MTAPNTGDLDDMIRRKVWAAFGPALLFALLLTAMLALLIAEDDTRPLVVLALVLAALLATGLTAGVLRVVTGKALPARSTSRRNP